MDGLIWAGAVVSVVGLVGIFWCIRLVLRARRSGASDEEMKATLARVMPLNMGALVLSAVGLMMVVFGIILA